MFDLQVQVDEAGLNTALTATLDCVVVEDHSGHIIGFNPAAERLFSYTYADVLGKPVGAQLLAPEVQALGQAGLGHHLDGGAGAPLSKHLTTIARRADGSTFPAEILILRLLTERHPMYLLFVRDISERRARELHLQRTMARFQELIARLQGGILVEDERRRIALVNNSFCTMFDISLPPDQLIGMDCALAAEDTSLLFTHPKRFVRRVDQILESRQPVLGELLHLRDSRVLSRDYVPIYHDEEYVGHLWHYRDVTADVHMRQRWERLLKLEEINREVIRLFLQLDDVDLAINEILAMVGYVMDVSRVYVFHFRQNERLLDNRHEWCAAGVAPQINNLKGLPFDELLPSFLPMLTQEGIIAPAHIESLPDDMKALLAAQDIQSVLILPLYTDGRLEGFIGCDEIRKAREWLPEEITTMRIITESYARALERQQTQHLLIAARDEALHTAQVRAQFVANMSHEIRTPMTGTLGMLELLLETELDELQREFAQEAHNSSSRLLHIINDILDFSRLDAGRVVLQAEPIDLKAVANEVRMTLKPQLVNRPVEILLDCDPALPHRVYGDANRLRQVLMNLGGNAIKFTHEGQVTLIMRVLSIHEDVALIEFAVSDTGIGIAPEHIERIFESFMQADGGTTRKYGGSGLGLSISQQLVTLMGGSIDVTSTPDAGSTFSFRLSLPIAAATGVDKQVRPLFAALRVLIVDGQPTGRYVLAQQIENWGIKVNQAASLEDAYRAVSSAPPPAYDLLFLRANSEALSSQHRRLAAHLARQVIHVSDTPATDPKETFLQWPVNSSTLYNLLITPIATPPASPPPIPPAPENSASRGRVLLADDYPLNIDIVQRALSELNIDLDTVTNGKEALEQLERKEYDLILMDIQMPVMDGLDATQRIRRSQMSYQDIPILALTAGVMQHERQRYIAAGINEVISKPFSVAELRTTVQEWLARVRPSRDAP